MKDFLHIAIKAILIFITLLGSNFNSFAQNWDQIIKANASDRNVKPASIRSEGDEFGFSVAISGDYAVVGADGEDEDMNGGNTMKNAGAAYILHLTDGKWKQVKKICPQLRGISSVFGTSVAIDGDLVVVGAPHHLNDLSNLSMAGAAFVFRKDEGGEDNWGQVKQLAASVPSQFANFGISVSVSGDYIAVGAYLEAEDAQELNTLSSSGAAYIFKRNLGGVNHWGQVKKLVASDRKETDQFGLAVAISGENVIIGAPFDDVTGSGGVQIKNAGSVYVFSKDAGGSDNWGQAKKMTAPNPVQETFIGGAVSISGDFAVVGYITDPGHYDFPETVYVFGKNKGGNGNWGLVKAIVPAASKTGDLFGLSVSISGAYIVVGALGESDDVNEQNDLSYSGSAYIFKQNLGGTDNWGQVKKLTAPHRELHDLFGNAVAINNGQLLIGARRDEDDENENNDLEFAGAAYLFQVDKGGLENWGLMKKAVTEELTPEDHYGYAVSISGNYAVVGSPYEDESQYGENTILDAGAAYIFFNNAGNWSQVKKIVANQRRAHDHFGTSVSINGRYIIIGAPEQDLDRTGENFLEDAGAAYIFYREDGVHNWQQSNKVTPVIRKAGDHFARSVSMGDNIAVAGAPDTEHASGENNYGSAYVFGKDQGNTNYWGQVKELTAPVRVDEAHFGQSVAISGNNLIVGAHGDTYDYRGTVITLTGAAYMFNKDEQGQNNWGLLKKMYCSNPANNDRFGYSVAISGAYAIVGAFNESQDSKGLSFISKAGSAFIYKQNQGGTDNWGLLKKITATSRSANDNFGSAVSINAQYAMVGAPGADLNIIEEAFLENNGAAYLFRKDLGGSDNWGQSQKITGNPRHSGDQFGNTLSLGDLDAIIGAPFDRKDATDQNLLEGAGSVFMFRTTAIPAGALPVKLTSFTATKVEGQALITWTTTSEVNSDYFEIQKSDDGHEWATIGNVAAASSSNTLLSYSFTDIKPNSGTALYRLKMVDLDGTFAFSNIRSLLFVSGNKVKVTIYPNPVSDRLYFDVAGSSEIESVQVINGMGQVMYRSTSVTREGIDLKHLSSGIYIVQIKKANGKMQAEKLDVIR